MLDLIIRNGQVVTTEAVESLDIGVKDGVIVRLANRIEEPAREEIDAAGEYVLPGMVDPHMHLSEPGRTEWEGYRTGTQAMAAGGITSFVEMPLNQIPCTTDIPSLEIKLKSAEGQCWVDYAPMGGLVPWNLADLAPLADAGVAAFKAFVATCGSGKPGDFKNVTDWELYQGAREIAKKDGLLVVHCENATITDGLGAEARASGKKSLSDYVASRPIFTEVEAVHRVLMIAEAAGCRIHIAHCSCPEAVEEVERARANQRRMWELLAEGRIEMLVSDHSPCTIDLKSSDNAFDAWGGISGCQNCVDAMFDEAVLKHGISPVTLAKALSTGAARRFRLKGKGEIALGFDADLVLIDPKTSYVLKAEDLLYKNKFSAYEGRRIDCRITHTLVRGNLAWSLEKGASEKPMGRRMTIAA